ncbi:MAG: hypothetical protein GY910_11045 [bacterium]|nr:hypothetical protein [bacterium]
MVLFLGFFLSRRVRLLEDNYIPPAVTGGVLFSLVARFGDAQLGIELEFDMRFRDLWLLVFFSTVRLSARLRTLPQAGRCARS